jgi:hypothetical protein
MVSLGRDVGIINAEEALCYFYMGIKHISKDPLISTYKRRPHPPHFNNTQERKSTKEVEEQHHSNGLRP